MKISVIGIGRIGLVVAAGLAKLGNEVTAIDVDDFRVKAANDKATPFHEPELDHLLQQVEIRAASDYRAILDSEVIFICANTPSREDGSIVLDYIIEATKRVASILQESQRYCVVVVKSTVVPGTAQEIVIPLLVNSGKRVGHDFGVCVVPEFLSEGTAVHNFLHPDRIIIGEYDSQSGSVLCDLYKSFRVPVLRVNLKTAEMIKYASNAFLATKVSFINEIGNICKLHGIDVFEVAKGMGLDTRIGDKFLNAGIGFGGPCFSKDLKAIISEAKRLGYRPGILEDVLAVNSRQARRIVALLQKHVRIKDKYVGILGLSYKPGTDDVTDSPVIAVVRTLLNKGAKIRAYDPQAMPNFKKLFPQIEYTNPQRVLDCMAVVVCTEWPEFEQLDYTGKIVIDGRRVSKAREAKVYEGICW